MEDLELEEMIWFSKPKEIDKTGKSMMELFIEEISDWDYVTEITEKEYKKLFSKKEQTFYIKDLDIAYNVDNPPFPLFKVHIISDKEWSYPNGNKDWELIFIFKHKGKHYIFCEREGS